jgi:flagella basal body P-ring formation protein FlgA
MTNLCRPLLAMCAVPRRSMAVRALLCAFLLCAPGVGALRVFAFPEAPGLACELRATAAVDSTGIYLHQLLARPIPGLPPESAHLAPAPGFGQAVVLSRDQLTALLGAAIPGWGVPYWSGAPSVRITRRARSLGEAELRDLLSATLQRDSVKDRGELELRLGRAWTPVWVPDEALGLKLLDLPAAGVSPNFIVRFELQSPSATDRLGPWQAVVQARVMKEILITRVPLRRGQGLQEGDFTLERRDVLALREPLDAATLRNPSLEVVEGVAAGQPLLARALRPRPVVQRGQMVDGLVRDGALQINLRVEVLADGLPGQIVRVRNPKTKREFYAKVQDEQSVLISL